MLNKNNKMAISNNKGVEKGCSKHQGPQVRHENFPFKQQGAPRHWALRVLNTIFYKTKPYDFTIIKKHQGPLVFNLFSLLF